MQNTKANKQEHETQRNNPHQYHKTETRRLTRQTDRQIVRNSPPKKKKKKKKKKGSNEPESSNKGELTGHVTAEYTAEYCNKIILWFAHIICYPVKWSNLASAVPSSVKSDSSSLSFITKSNSYTVQKRIIRVFVETYYAITWKMLVFHIGRFSKALKRFVCRIQLI